MLLVPADLIFPITIPPSFKVIVLLLPSISIASFDGSFLFSILPAFVYVDDPPSLIVSSVLLLYITPPELLVMVVEVEEL